MAGSDVPWTPYTAAKGLLNKLYQDLPAHVGEENLDLINRGNAEELFLQGCKQSVIQKTS